jgi:hypothetical protein
MFGPDHCGTDNKVHAILSFADKNEQIKNKIRADKDQLTRKRRQSHLSRSLHVYPQKGQVVQRQG